MDARDEEISNQIIKQGERVSVCVPDNTQYYKVQLVSSGCHRFLFEGIYVAEEQLADYTVDRYWISDLLHQDSEKETMYVCFTEPELNRTGFIPERVREHFSNVLIVNSSYREALLYMEERFYETLLETIEELAQEHLFEKVAFVGYGAISNIAALHYSKQFGNSYALVTDEFLSELDYQRLLERYRSRVNPPIFKELLLQQFNPTKVKEYADLKTRPRELANIEYLLDKSFLLQAIDLEKIEEWMRENEN